MGPRHVTFIAPLLAAVLALLAGGCGGQSSSAGTTLTNGTGFANAIKVGSVGEERDILNRSSCDGGSYYRVAQLHIQHLNGRYYDVVNAECVKGSQKRQYYFDVTKCFPCKD